MDDAGEGGGAGVPFLSVNPPRSEEGWVNKSIMHDVCKDVSMPVEPEKDEGPATSIDFLGLHLDTEALEIHSQVNQPL